jgi:hypothetical protein
MGFPPSGKREGAILDPTEAPTTTPTSEKTPARNPVLAPRKTETTMKMPINRSRTLKPAESTHGFYPRRKTFAFAGWEYSGILLHGCPVRFVCGRPSV